MQIFTNALNIGLDFLFVFGFGWGVAGVAAPRSSRSTPDCSSACVRVADPSRPCPTAAHAAACSIATSLLRMMSINTDIVLRTLCVVSVLGFFMAKSAELGDLTLAANQVLHNFLFFTSFGLDGVAHAAEAILGEAVGRRDRQAFRRSMRVVFLWAGIVGLAQRC